MNKRLAKLQKELDISDTHNMPSTDIILKNVNNKINAVSYTHLDIIGCNIGIFKLFRKFLNLRFLT